MHIVVNKIKYPVVSFNSRVVQQSELQVHAAMHPLQSPDVFQEVSTDPQGLHTWGPAAGTSKAKQARLQEFHKK